MTILYMFSIMLHFSNCPASQFSAALCYTSAVAPLGITFEPLSLGSPGCAWCRVFRAVFPLLPPVVSGFRFSNLFYWFLGCSLVPGF